MFIFFPTADRTAQNRNIKDNVFPQINSLTVYFKLKINRTQFNKSKSFTRSLAINLFSLEGNISEQRNVRRSSVCLFLWFGKTQKRRHTLNIYLTSEVSIQINAFFYLIYDRTKYQSNPIPISLSLP